MFPSSSFSPLLPPPNFFLNIDFTTSLKIGAAALAISPNGISPPFRLLRLFSPKIPNSLFYRLRSLFRSFSHSSKSSSSWLIAYVLCLSISPLLDNMYKYSSIEYAQTLNINFFDAAALRWIQGILFHHFLLHYNHPRLSILNRLDYSCNRLVERQ